MSPGQISIFFLNGVFTGGSVVTCNWKLRGQFPEIACWHVNVFINKQYIDPYVMLKT